MTVEQYLMPATDAEAARLRWQSDMLRTFTERVLDAAEVAPGDHCLDAGCGSGEVMPLLGARAGLQGSVLGLDLHTDAVRKAAVEWEAVSPCRYDVVAGSIEACRSLGAARFDVVFARLVLLHQIDPAETTHRLWSMVKPGGRMILVDADMTSMAAYPPHHGVDEYRRVVLDVLRTTGADPAVGTRLPSLMKEACGSGPDGTDTWTALKPAAEVRDWLRHTYEGILPRALALGVTTPGQVAATRRAFDEALGDDYFYRIAVCTAVWKRKTADIGQGAETRVQSKLNPGVRV